MLAMRAWALGLACCLLGTAQADEGAQVYAARVTRVFDGDTVWVKPLAGGAYRKLRLSDIDAPEICQTDGVAARDALAARVSKQVVLVRTEHRDTYGRELAQISHQGDDINAWLVSQGWAWAYVWRTSEGPYAAQEAAARGARRGLFAAPAPQTPRDFRQAHGACETRSGVR